MPTTLALPKPTRFPVGGPPLVEHDPAINRGRPTSIEDVEYERTTGNRLFAGQHARRVNRNGIFIGWTVVSNETLWDEECARSGRNPKLSLETLTTIKNDYWNGQATIKSLAATHRLDLKTVWRIVHGLTCWYA